MPLSALIAVVLGWVTVSATAATSPGVPAAVISVETRETQTPVNPALIRFVHMGGNDCPPCVAWRAFEYPKLEKSALFQRISYSHITKSIRSPVPAEIFLPTEIKPFKTRLDVASGGRGGSPHQALMVDGVVYDYWFGAKNAEEIEARIASMVSGTPYPSRRCIRRAGGSDRSCAEYK